VEHERDLPSALIGETGVWKKITEETITTTRFTQFPTECVTGDTFSNIPYETCHQIHLAPISIIDVTMLNKYYQINLNNKVQDQINIYQLSISI
jgi:hypothetical protein